MTLNGATAHHPSDEGALLLHSYERYRTHSSHNSVRERVGALARGSLIIPHSLSSVYHRRPPLYSIPRISPRFDATVIGRMRGKVGYLDEYFDVIRDGIGELVKFYLRAADYRIYRNAISECVYKNYETVS